MLDFFPQTSHIHHASLSYCGSSCRYSLQSFSVKGTKLDSFSVLIAGPVCSHLYLPCSENKDSKSAVLLTTLQFSWFFLARNPKEKKVQCSVLIELFLEPSYSKTGVKRSSNILFLRYQQLHWCTQPCQLSSDASHCCASCHLPWQLITIPLTLVSYA